MGSNPITVLIYEEDAKLINEWTLQYPDIETGGDLFGLWQDESEVVVQLAIGPGKNCRRTTTSFFQDEHYLGTVGSHLTSTQGLCNIGEWHSHHSLNLPEPSSGDKRTIWRHLPTYKLDRFLLFIATINQDNGHPEIHSFMFTSPENASMHGGMFPTHFVILPGPNPFHAQEEIEKKLSQGAEIIMVRGDAGGEKESKKEKKRGKKEGKRRKKEEKKRKKQEDRDKKDAEKKEKKNKKKTSKGMKETRRCRSNSQIKLTGYNMMEKGQDGIEQAQEMKSENKPQDNSNFVTPDHERQRVNAQRKCEYV